VGVLAELMNDDGTVMRGPGVIRVCRAPQLKHDLDRRSHRLPPGARQVGPSASANFRVQSKIGTLAGYAYVTPSTPSRHMAFVYGRIGHGRDMLARLHRADIIRGRLRRRQSGARCVAAFPSRMAAALSLFLRDGAAGVPTHAIPQSGSTARRSRRSRQWREVGPRRQILKDLGISSIRLLTSPSSLCGSRRLRDRDRAVAEYVMAERCSSGVHGISDTVDGDPIRLRRKTLGLAAPSCCTTCPDPVTANEPSARLTEGSNQRCMQR